MEDDHWAGDDDDVIEPWKISAGGHPSTVHAHTHQENDSARPLLPASPGQDGRSVASGPSQARQARVCFQELLTDGSRRS